MRAAVDAAHEFLDRDLIESKERLVQDLEANQALLAARVKRAVERGRHELGETFARWERIHPMTLGAVCRRGGVYSGAHRNDFPAELSKPILDSIAFAWSDFFGERLQQTLEKWMGRLLDNGDDFHVRLAKSLAAVPDVSSSLVSSVDEIL
jgi:hypothetical protein